jgi:hypothetical protein
MPQELLATYERARDTGVVGAIRKLEVPVNMQLSFAASVHDELPEALGGPA